MVKPEIVNTPDDRGGYTSLHQAALKGNEVIAKILIDNGANVNGRTVNGKTPLQKATEKNRPKIVNLLVRNGANVNAVYNAENRTALHLASRNNYDKIVEALISHGASIDYQNKFGRTALMKAIEGGKFKSNQMKCSNRNQISLNANDLI